MKYAFFFSAFLLLISCSKNEKDLEKFSQDVVDEYINYIIEVGDKLLALDDDQLLQTMLDIEAVSLREGMSIDDYATAMSEILEVDKKSISSYLDLCSLHPEISTLESLKSVIHPRFEQLLNDNVISLYGFDKQELELRRICEWWEAGLAVVGGALTLISCGGCVAGVLPSCVGCVYGGITSYNTSQECFF